ncbi:MAG TPA: SLBB domain-containing protein [Candidatus Eisenbacteria bacterium]
MRRWLASAGCILALLAAGSSRGFAEKAESEPREPALPAIVPLAGTIDPGRYRLGPGDVMRLALFGPLSREATLAVTPEGTLFLADMGAVHVAGLTLNEARQVVTTRIRGALRGVGVELQLMVPRTFRVYLTGELRLTGPRTASATSRIVDVLPDTLFLPTSSRRRIEVRSLDGSVRIADVDRFRLAGDMRGEAALSDGDVVHVPVANQFLAAWGGVGRPGRYELGERDSLSTLLQLAGGLREDAVPGRALLVRWTDSRRESVWVSLADRGATGLGLPLRNGDELHVFTQPDYHLSERVEITGRVAVTGSYPVRAGVTRLSQLLASAGGVLPDADTASVLLFRARPPSGPDPEFDRLSRLSRGEMTASEYATFRTRLAGLSPDFRVDLRTVRPGSPNDPLLADGDHVLVARVVRSIRVDGQVRRPGVVEFEPGRPWAWYVRQCGGFTARSARGQARLTRASSGQTMLARETDVPLAGDFLWVPERSEVPTWQYLRDTILVLAQVATVFIALRK